MNALLLWLDSSKSKKALKSLNQKEEQRLMLIAGNDYFQIFILRTDFASALQVYRIGMVLNKVGWYPMGVCTRRVNSEECFFTFCVGQPSDTLRDGLIRSIIFSK